MAAVSLRPIILQTFCSVQTSPSQSTRRAPVHMTRRRIGYGKPYGPVVVEAFL